MSQRQGYAVCNIDSRFAKCMWQNACGSEGWRFRMCFCFIFLSFSFLICLVSFSYKDVDFLRRGLVLSNRCSHFTTHRFVFVCTNQEAGADRSPHKRKIPHFARHSPPGKTHPANRTRLDGPALSQTHLPVIPQSPPLHSPDPRFPRRIPLPSAEAPFSETELLFVRRTNLEVEAV